MVESTNCEAKMSIGIGIADTRNRIYKQVTIVEGEIGIGKTKTHRVRQCKGK